MNIFTKPFYINSPLIIQECLTSLHGLGFKLIKAGKLSKDILSKLEKSQYYSKEELRQLQIEKLKLMVKHSYENVPYYSRLFRKLHLTPRDFNHLSDLAKIPFITKEEVKKNPEDFLAVNLNRFFIRKVCTSGTTGSPLRIYRDLYCINFENAILNRQYRWAGFYPGQKKMVLRASPVVASKVKKAPFWRHDFFQKSLLASGYHLSKQNIPYYVKKILRYKPVALETIPSTGYLLAKLMYLQDMNVDFKYIFTSSEVLLPYQKKFMQDYLKAQIFDYYGTAERVSAIGTCEKGTYHIYPEYGITELLPLEDKKGRFEIVGTVLNNFAMPLFRYRTGDLVTPASQKCSCGRDFQTIESIDGRERDHFFVTKDGRLVSVFCQILSIDLENVIEAQFVQEGLARMRVKVVPGKRYGVSDDSAIINSIKKYLGNDIKIDIEKVPYIQRGAGGKFRQFISNINATISESSTYSRTYHTYE